MPSTDDGIATSALELKTGYPGYFYEPGDGDFIDRLDRSTGLPIRKCGDCAPDVKWISGFNSATQRFAREQGLPWNSRLKSIDLVANLATYFETREDRAQELSLDSETHPVNDGAALQLVSEGLFGGPAVRLSSPQLFHDPKIVPNAMTAYRTGSPPAVAETKAPPTVLQPGVAVVDVRFYAGYQRIRCVPGPGDSQLVVFQFSEFQPQHDGHSPLNYWVISRDCDSAEDNVYAALDIQLADWIPGVVGDGVELPDWLLGLYE